MGETLKNKRLIALFLLSILSVLTGGLLVPIEMRFLNEISHNSSLSSYAFAISTIASMLGAIIISQIANRFGRDKPLKFLLIFNIFVPILYSSIYSILQAYGIKFAWAFSLAGVGTIAGALIQQEVSLLKNYEGVLFGILYSLESAAGALGAILSGFIADKFGLTSIFYCVFIISILQLLIISVCFGFKNKNIVHVKFEKKGNLIDGAKFIWMNNELRSRFILITAYGISWDTKAILYPLVIFQIAMSNTLTGAILGTQGIVAMIVLPYIGKLVDRVGYSKIISFGYAILGLAILFLSLAPKLWMVWLAVSLVAVGEACSNGPAMSTLEVKNIPENLRNSVIALHRIYSNIIGVAATLLIGLFLSNNNPQKALIFVALSIFFAMLLAQGVCKEKDKTIA